MCLSDGVVSLPRADRWYRQRDLQREQLRHHLQRKHAGQVRDTMSASRLVLQ
jgi:hypothetical protein